MASRKHNLTLTRWHKVAERLQQEIGRQSAEIDNAYGRSRFDPALKQGMRLPELMESLRGTVEGAVTLNVQLLAVIATIRTELAKANARLGVAERLSTMDNLNKQVKMLETILTHERDRTVHYEDFAEMAASAAPENVYGQRTSIPVKLLTTERLAALQAQVTDMRRRVHGLTDEINDVNRSLISIELDDEVAAIAGLDKGE